MLICRKRPERPIEGLLVHRRYTYAFAEFVHGHHQGVTRPQELKALLSGMTVGELLLVGSGEFKRMYDYLWANQKMNGDLYERKAGKFAHCFMRRGQNLQTLKALVTQTRPTGQLWWEPPKGRQSRPHESGITTAVREAEEEAGIERKSYNILPGYQREERYGSGVVYHHIYYAAAARGALARGSFRPVLQMKNPAQIAEIDGVRWMTADEMRGADHDGRLGATVIRLLRQVSRGWYGRQDLAGISRKRAGRHLWPGATKRRDGLRGVPAGKKLRDLRGVPGVLVLPVPGSDRPPLRRPMRNLAGREDVSPKKPNRSEVAKRRGSVAGGAGGRPVTHPPPGLDSDRRPAQLLDAPRARDTRSPGAGDGWQVVGPSGSHKRL